MSLLLVRLEAAAICQVAREGLNTQISVSWRAMLANKSSLRLPGSRMAAKRP